jgi:hypothetical protein
MFGSSADLVLGRIQDGDPRCRLRPRQRSVALASRFRREADPAYHLWAPYAEQGAGSRDGEGHTHDWAGGGADQGVHGSPGRSSDRPTYEAGHQPYSPGPELACRTNYGHSWVPPRLRVV